MKPKKAIKTIEVAKAECEWNAPLDYQEAFDMAISALQAQDVHGTNDGDMISRRAAIEALDKQFWRFLNIPICKEIRNVAQETIKALPSVQPEWNNHTVACLLAELFSDNCACNFNGIDEWLPEKCEVIDACPNPVGVACWEQYLKHRAERRADD